MIVGVTDLKSVTPQIQIIGELVKGEKKPGKNKIGKDLRYFRMKSENPKVVEMFNRIYGSEPDSLPVYLPFGKDWVNPDTGEVTDVIYRNFYTIRQKYDGPTHVRTCNGQKVLKERVGAYLRPVDEFKACNWPDCGCKGKGWLYIIIPELWEAFDGIVKVRTTSEAYDMPILTAQLLAIKETMEKIGKKINDAPLVLSRLPQSTSSGAKGYAHKVRWMLNLAIDPRWAIAETAKLGLESSSFFNLQLPDAQQNTKTLPAPTNMKAFALHVHAPDTPPSDQAQQALPAPEPPEPEQPKVETRSPENYDKAFLKIVRNKYGAIEGKRKYGMTKKQAISHLAFLGYSPPYKKEKQHEMLEALACTQEGCMVKVNGAIGVEHYTHPNHLFNACKKELPSISGFPTSGIENSVDWETYELLAIEHYEKEYGNKNKGNDTKAEEKAATAEAVDDAAKGEAPF